MLNAAAPHAVTWKLSERTPLRSLSAPGEAAKLAPLAAYLFWKSTPPTATTPIGLTDMRARSLTAMEYVKRVEAESREQALMERQDQEARDMARQKREDEATDGG